MPPAVEKPLEDLREDDGASAASKKRKKQQDDEVSQLFALPTAPKPRYCNSCNMQDGRPHEAFCETQGITLS